MKATYERSIRAKCPKDGSTDWCRLVLRADRMLLAEDINKAVEEATAEPAFQEDITERLAAVLRCEAETAGWHSGVKATIVCGESGWSTPSLSVQAHQ